VGAGCDVGGLEPVPRDASARPVPTNAAGATPPRAASPEPIYDLVTPAAPGTPGGLPDDRMPVSEAPFSPTSAQGAANVVQTYYAYLGAGFYEEAWRLWDARGQGRGANVEDFTRGFAEFDSYRASVGAPGAIKGAAGSSYVTVPVQISARFKDGRELRQLGSATLRRSNGVAGAAAEQRSWRIQAISLEDH
jgi:hypothetical protein